MDIPQANKEMTSKTGSTANVLIVDDDPQLARLILEILAQKSIRGIIAETLDAAVHSLEKADYDLVFTNDRLSLRPGDEKKTQNVLRLLDNIKANSPEMPVIIIADVDRPRISNNRQIAEAAVRAIQAGCSDFRNNRGVS